MFKLFGLLSWFVFAGVNLKGQLLLQKTKFTRIEVSAGLSNSNVTCILQDRKGFLWVGTEDGLNKYDGYEFTIYRHRQQDSLSLVKNSINSLFEDSRGRVWVLTRGGGVHLYDRKLDAFRRVSEFTFNCDMIRVLEDSKKRLWICGTRLRYAFIASLDPTTLKAKYYNLFPSAEPVVAMIEEGDGMFWIGVRQTGLFKWNSTTNLVTHYPNQPGKNSVTDNDIVNMIRDARGNMWIGTRNGLSKYDARSRRFTNFKAAAENPSGLPVNTIRDLCADNNYIWLATENGGLSRLNTIDNTFTNFQYRQTDPSSISDNSVWAVYKDHQGRIWAGTFSKGLCVTDHLKEKFQELDIQLENDIVNAIWQDSRGRLWIGTEGGLVRKDRDKIRIYRHDPSKPNSLSSDPVLSIFEDSKKQMWFGTWAGGVNKYNDSSDGFTHFSSDSTKPQSLSNPNVYSIKEDRVSGKILVASYNGLNVLVDEARGRFQTFRDEAHESNNYLRQILSDSRGDLWIGSIGEFNRFDLASGERERFYYHNDSTMYDAITNCIIEDRVGRIWIGSNNGLHLMGENKFIESYTVKDGLPNNIVTGILEADDGTLWLSTTEGISQFDLQRKTFQNYSVADGMLSNEFKPNSCFKSNDGLMFFGGKGITLFDPLKIRKNPHIPPVYITDLKIFNNSIRIGEYDSLLSGHISEMKEIAIPERFNFFSIQFVALNFSASSKNKYAYILEGFDKDWVFPENERSATFTNLDPGTYTFRVKACNNDGLWNEVGASLVIRILPPWYKTTTAKIVFALAMISLIITLYNLRIRRIQRTNDKLERLVRERTSQLHAANEELKERKEVISRQNKELRDQQDELSTQNEELIQQREELAAHNEALLVSKKSQLDMYTQKITEKSEIIHKISAELDAMKSRSPDNSEHVRKFNQILQSNILTEDDWERFKSTFNDVYPGFFAALRFRFPDITSAESRLAALIKMNVSVKEASTMLGISAESVKKSRYRLRKKLALGDGESLESFIQRLG